MNRTANSILDEKFLDVRAKLLEVAADFDRIDRAASDEGPLSGQSRDHRERLGEAINILRSDGADRAERLQKLFSRDYESSWRKEMQI
ncbi:hypothetical protein [Planctomycetes bacterium K23_9]|uniref:Uncharacterized protein n=1 Tax=Stieleria marina TaxID=1930275 RepID=A0A517NY73_9BACT|nr:hypothetical protein K239x_40800 [Planctomycetes bacterium K23_9]